MNITGPGQSTQAQCMLNNSINAELNTINVGLNESGWVEGRMLKWRKRCTEREYEMTMSNFADLADLPRNYPGSRCHRKTDSNLSCQICVTANRPVYLFSIL